MAFLISLPCADSQECNIAVRTQKISEATSHQEHSHESEACPPLCVCMCCTSYAYFQDFRQVTAPQPEIISLEYPYNEQFTSYDYQSIWQPPKIG